MLRLAAIVLVWALSCETGSAEVQSWSANQFMPACREYVADTNKYPFGQGSCVGMVVGVTRAHPMICRPAGVSNVQLVRVVIQYVDQRPARHHEDFMELAAEVLQPTWPCRR